MCFGYEGRFTPAVLNSSNYPYLSLLRLMYSVVQTAALGKPYHTCTPITYVRTGLASSVLRIYICILRISYRLTCSPYDVRSTSYHTAAAHFRIFDLFEYYTIVSPPRRFRPVRSSALLAVTFKTPSKEEWLLGVTYAQMSFHKALQVLGISEGERRGAEKDDRQRQRQRRQTAVV